MKWKWNNEILNGSQFRIQPFYCVTNVLSNRLFREKLYCSWYHNWIGILISGLVSSNSNSLNSIWFVFGGIGLLFWYNSLFGHPFDQSLAVFLRIWKMYSHEREVWTVELIAIWTERGWRRLIGSKRWVQSQDGINQWFGIVTYNHFMIYDMWCNPIFMWFWTSAGE